MNRRTFLTGTVSAAVVIPVVAVLPTKPATRIAPGIYRKTESGYELVGNSLYPDDKLYGVVWS